MLTTDRGQEISIIDKGIQINSPESTQVINFADINSLVINENNVLQITVSGVVMQYQLINTDIVRSVFCCLKSEIYFSWQKASHTSEAICSSVR